MQRNDTPSSPITRRQSRASPAPLCRSTSGGPDPVSKTYGVTSIPIAYDSGSSSAATTITRIAPRYGRDLQSDLPHREKTTPAISGALTMVVNEGHHFVISIPPDRRLRQ